MLASLLLLHVVVVIRDQYLSAREHVEFAGRFGQLEQFPQHASRSGDEPWQSYIFPVANHVSQGYTRVGLYWHADGYFYHHPTAVSIMRPVQLPPVGGATSFANMAEAYKSLPPELLATVDGRVATSHPVPPGAYSTGFGKTCPGGARHRLVRPHPVHKRPVLFLNPNNIASIDGLTSDETQSLIAALISHVDRSDSVYCHQWEPGDLVMWDNAGGAHKASTPDVRYERLMERTTLVGDAYYGSDFWQAAAGLASAGA
jgi:taurine dioxygenase